MPFLNIFLPFSSSFFFFLLYFYFWVYNLHANNALFLFICAIRVGDGNILGCAKYSPEIARIKMNLDDIHDREKCGIKASW